jgi:RNA polymerase sigma factor (sigma-70 family)
MGERGDFDSWLVLLAQTGSRDALDQLFKGIQAPLFRYINSLVKDTQHAEDILQEVFVRIYRKLKWLREPSAFRAWCYQIASRETFRYLKRERSWSEQVRDEELLRSIPDGGKELIAFSEVTEGLVEALSPASRAVVVLFYLHELTLTEIAAALDLPIGTVKSRLAYGLESLRRQVRRGNDNANKR